MLATWPTPYPHLLSPASCFLAFSFVALSPRMASPSTTSPSGSSKDLRRVSGHGAANMLGANAAARRGSTPDTAAVRRPRTKEELRRCSPEELSAIKSGDEYTRRRCSLPTTAAADPPPKGLHEAMEEIKECRYLRGGASVEKMEEEEEEK